MILELRGDSSSSINWGQGVVHDRYAAHVEDAGQHEANAIVGTVGGGRKSRHGLFEEIGKMLHISDKCPSLLPFTIEDRMPKIIVISIHREQP